MTPEDEETESDSAEDDTEESEESESVRSKPKESSSHFFHFPNLSFSYKRLSKRCLKLSFLCVNGATFLSGIIATIVSIWMLADGELMSRLLGQRVFVSVLFLIGVAASAVSFLGITALLKKNRPFLAIYILIHLTSLCSMFVCAVTSISIYERVVRKIRDEMLTTIVNYHSLDWVTEAWDNTQSYLRCCGIKSYNDWSSYNMDIPKSCCSFSIDKCFVMNKDIAYQTGCLKGVLIYLKSYVHSGSIVAIFVAIILGICVFLSVGVCKRVIPKRPLAVAV